MSKNRNPYAMAHSLRGGAGAGAHKDHRRELEEEWWDPYSPEWLDLCERAPVPAPVDNDVKNHPSGSTRPQPLSRDFLLQRGHCCGSGCQNCPYEG